MDSAESKQLIIVLREVRCGCFNYLITTTSEGNKEYKNTDRALRCAMTNVGENFLKTPSHSEDNNILSPKNLFKELQEDLSLSAQDDENDLFTMKFSGMHRSCYCMSALRNYGRVRTWRASNEIHICVSYMNDSYEREVISRRHANTKLVLLYLLVMAL